MGTTYEHIQLGVVDSKGDVKVLYPVNTASDVSVKTENTSIPSTVKNVQDIVDNIGDMAFVKGKDVVYLGESTEYPGNLVESEINDKVVGKSTTWSSDKILNFSTSFIPSYKMSIDIINKLYIYPVVFNVDSRTTVFNDVSPEAGKLWNVEYFPITTSVNDMTGNPGGSNNVISAVQRWTGIPYAEDSSVTVVYERTFTKGSWNDFVKVR